MPLATKHPMIMKRTLSLLTASVLFVACQSETTLEDKAALLEEKKNQLSELRQEIKALEGTLNQADSLDLQQPQKLTPVSLQKLAPRPFEHFLRLTGMITSNQNVMISAEAMGRVTSIAVEEGAVVKKGQTLLTLNNEAMRNQLREAAASFDLAKTTFERRKALWQDSIGSEIDYLSAKTNYEAARNRLGQIRAQLDNTIIQSPINGVVDKIHVNEGEFLSVGAPVARVVDMANLEVETEISEEYLNAVNKGDTVKVSVPSLEINQLQPIVFTGQYINPNNRSFRIKVELDNQDAKLKPNLLAELAIRDYYNPSALVVPAIAIKKDLKGEYVFVLASKEGRQIARKQYVKKGYSFGNRTEVLTGLKQGDRVVTAGFNQVSDNEEVRVASED